MSTESEPIHTIRMSTQDWNELLVTAINAGYKNRTEYIRAVLRGKHLQQSAPPLVEIVPPNPLPVTLQTEMERIAYQATLDELRREISAHKAEIVKLRDTAQTTPVKANPHSTKTPVHRFPFASVLKHWPEARRNRYNKLPVQPTEWVNATLETVYDMLDELE
jgi:hypothetical protein